MLSLITRDKELASVHRIVGTLITRDRELASVTEVKSRALGSNPRPLDLRFCSPSLYQLYFTLSSDVGTVFPYQNMVE